MSTTRPLGKNLKAPHNQEVPTSKLASPWPNRRDHSSSHLDLLIRPPYPRSPEPEAQRTGGRGDVLLTTHTLSRSRDAGVRRVPYSYHLSVSGTFNSLFKVLCIFPSLYLFAIGLPPIFSFRWNLPPTLSCNPKQLDSLNTIKSFRQERESHPLCCLFPKDLARNS